VDKKKEKKFKIFTMNIRGNYGGNIGTHNNIVLTI
jgi:hypothetical protein